MKNFLRAVFLCLVIACVAFNSSLVSFAEIEPGSAVSDGVIIESEDNSCGCCHKHEHGDDVIGIISCFLCRVIHIIKPENKGDIVHKYIVISQSESDGLTTAELKCAVCGKTDSDKIETYNDTSNNSLLVCYRVCDGRVIDTVSGNEMAGALIEGDYFKGGTVSLPSSIDKGTLEIVMNYNRLSLENPTGEQLSYYGGAFLFREINDISYTGNIKAPFSGGAITTGYTLRASINNLNNKLLPGGDSFFCLAFDKNESSWALQINDEYNTKSGWSNYFSKSFKLSGEHLFKEVRIYGEKLSKACIAHHYRVSQTGFISDGQRIIGRITDGITDLGPALAFTKTVGSDISQWYNAETKAGTYTVFDGNGMNITYTVRDYVEPDNGIDNSKYESVHIIKKPESVYVGYKYALSAVPYPFNVNHSGKSDQFDVSWKSSDSSVASVIDGLLIAKKEGTVTVTATLKGTNKTDSCKIKIVKKASSYVMKKLITEDYVSKNGYFFSDTDYEMTTRAIYDAIEEAYLDGYTHVIFPEIDFYAVPLKDGYHIPTGMTVEFPKGSAFHMMPSEFARNNGYNYFYIGWPTYDSTGYAYDKPVYKAKAEKNSAGRIIGYYCDDARLIVDEYYGEFYEENADMATLSKNANQYVWKCVFAAIGRNARYCSVEVHKAECTTGFFISLGAKTGSQEMKGYNRDEYQISAGDFVKGRYNDSGKIISDKNWYSIEKFYPVLSGYDGTDILHNYFLGEWSHNVSVYTQHFYDILWFDKDYSIIGIDRMNFTDETYVKPENAAYFKLSMQMSSLPENSLTDYIQLHPSQSAQFCEIKNTNVINGADGLLSIIGNADNCIVHDNYISCSGLLNSSTWAMDSEDGWLGIRGTVFEHNIIRRYTYKSSIGDYTGKDTGALAITSGFNTFVISNYLGSLCQAGNNAVCTHFINNVATCSFSQFKNGSPKEMNSKIWAHSYYNYMSDFASENTTSNGTVYSSGNIGTPHLNYW